MKIKIVHAGNNKFIPKRKFLFWWIQVSEFEFINHNACLNWLTNTYAPSEFNSKSSSRYIVEEMFQFKPEHRDKIDIDFM